MQPRSPRRTVRTAVVALVLGLCLTAAPTSHADLVELRINPPKITGTATPMSESYTGTLSFDLTSTTTLTTLRNDSAGGFSFLSTADIASLAGSLVIDNGDIVSGGDVVLTLTNGDVFSASVLPRAEAIVDLAAAKFNVFADLSMTSFDAATFAGVDVSAFGQPGLGLLKITNFDLDASGMSDLPEIDIFLDSATTGAPEPASLALLGLGAMSLLGRRRRA